MKNISILRNVVVDRQKLATLCKGIDHEELAELLDVKTSQVANLRRGERRPSANGLLRLMMMYGIKPEDIAGVEAV